MQLAGCNFSLQKPQSSSLEKTRKYASIVKKMKTFPEDTKPKAPHFIISVCARTNGRPNAEMTIPAVRNIAVSFMTFEALEEKSSLNRLAIIVGTGAKA